MIRVIFICFTGLMLHLQPCGAQDRGLSEEDRFKAEIDAWMRPYRMEKQDELDSLLTYIQKENKLPPEAPAYEHMKAFYHKHRKTYRRLRLKSLERYPEAPDTFPGYTHTAISQLDMADMDLDVIGTLLQDILNIRTLDVAGTVMTQNILSVPVFRYLQDKRGTPMSGMMEDHGYGSLIFTDREDHDNWWVIHVNRIFIFRYRWNIDTNRIGEPELWLNDGSVQQAGWLEGELLKPSDAQQELIKKLTACLWSLYDRKYHQRDTDCKSAADFLNSHRAEYIRIRAGRLGRLPAPPENWKEVYSMENENVVEDILRSMSWQENGKYHLPVSMSHPEFGYESTLFNFQMWLPDPAGTFIKSWLSGNEVYATSKGGMEWELTALYENYAVTYSWNIRTDEISDLQCLERDMH